MKAVGEVMSIGQNFKEAFQKAVRSLEIGRAGLGRVKKMEALSTPELREKITYGNSERFFQIYELLRRGVAVEEIVKLTRITPYFIEQMKELADFDFPGWAGLGFPFRGNPAPGQGNGLFRTNTWPRFSGAGKGRPRPPAERRHHGHLPNRARQRRGTRGILLLHLQRRGGRSSRERQRRKS